MKKRTVVELLRNGTIILIRVYRHTVSIHFGPCCRFTPSCSSYALVSVERFGIVTGTWLSLKRILRCHPFHPGGYDPVPETIK